MINQVTLVGRLTKHPEVRHTADGTPLLQTTIAVSRPYRNAKGETDTDFIYCTVWGRLAETAAKYSEKGSLVAVLGMIQTRNYKDSNGKTVYVTEVLVQTIRFLSKKQQEMETKELPGVIQTVPLI
ncbi:single-stranded DNA-binding protein [Domibacillus sp. A3M-37]|uniref:single-stranded DNA-binding protein n=1 Tax=Domibacillus TaxID=1433999 RepID=UPI0006182276|nr:MULTISPECIES: single-stranded DNA-binding protein [Domibacillus]MCP3761452.1 single-stranded DNA-binding protein [Domibacillus sp. A3M-37]